MHKKLELKKDGKTVMGQLDGPELPEGKVAPLIIFDQIAHQASLSKTYRDLLTKQGALTFTFTAKNIEDAQEKIEVAFACLRERSEVYGEMILLAGQAQGARAAMLSAIDLGASVKGLILLSPSFLSQDLKRLGNYPGHALVTAASQDDIIPLDQIKKATQLMAHGDFIELRKEGHVYSDDAINRVAHLIQLFIVTTLNH